MQTLWISSAVSYRSSTSFSNLLYPSFKLPICRSAACAILELDAVCSWVYLRRGRENFEVSASMEALISCVSKRTFERGVDRSRGTSVGLFVSSTIVFAKAYGENDGDNRVS
ncbi:hypothetical protein GcM1_237045 [Golovinomyces cichoracearum]|uniref:Uncharacterized protein n=1 Tax=Golovinomyces cichoracearum TaxID=62708 RepID=A0A420IJU6_9PEZI|nr:hypothetical protein GcM1_237045 [Golovinomyces cichoracearum]